MSERKVLNKYYPPDFDPNKIPKLRRARNRQFNIRIMAPFNMRCGTCGEYIYKGKKFNSRQERVENEDYLGLMIFRFYIKCPRCVSEISFKTDPKNTDYELEAGATRNFEALRTAEILAERELKEKEAEEKDNPMKVLENRTKSSRQEMEMIETLEELREMNSRHAKLDHEQVLALHKAYEEQLSRLQDEEDEAFVRSIFGKSSSGESVKRIHDDDDDDFSDDDDGGSSGLSSASSTPKVARLGQKVSDILVQDSPVSSLGDVKDVSKQESSINPKPAAKKVPQVWQKSVGGLSSKNSLVGLVKKKTTTNTSSGNTMEKTSVKVPSANDKTSGAAEKTAHIPLPAAAVSQTETGKGSATAAEKNFVFSSKQETPKNLSTDNLNSESKMTNSSSGTKSTGLGLGLLGAYSDSESDGSS